MLRPLVFYHASCYDGFTAAWVAHQILGDAAEYHPVNYGAALPFFALDPPRRLIYVLDFSWPRTAPTSPASRTSSSTWSAAGADWRGTTSWQARRARSSWTTPRTATCGDSGWRAVARAPRGSVPSPSPGRRGTAPTTPCSPIAGR